MARSFMPEAVRISLRSIFHNDLLQYDPVNDSWTPLAPSPDYHYHSQAVYFDGKIYNIGGYNENLSEVTDTTRIYDIDTNTWTTGAPMPQALAQMATVLWNGVIYVAGGNNAASRVNTLYAYDIASDTWTTLEHNATGTDFARLRRDQR